MSPPQSQSWPLVFRAVAAKIEAMPCGVVPRCMPWTFICFHISYMAFPAYLGEKSQMTKVIMKSISTYMQHKDACRGTPRREVPVSTMAWHLKSSLVKYGKRITEAQCQTYVNAFPCCLSDLCFLRLQPPILCDKKLHMM